MVQIRIQTGQANPPTGRDQSEFDSAPSLATEELHTDPGADRSHLQRLLSANWHLKYQILGIVSQTLTNTVLGGVIGANLQSCNGFLDGIDEGAPLSSARTKAVVITFGFTLVSLIYPSFAVQGFRMMSQIYGLIPAAKKIKCCCTTIPIIHAKYIACLTVIGASTALIYGTNLAHMCNNTRIIVWAASLPVNILGHVCAIHLIRKMNDEAKNSLRVGLLDGGC